MKYLVTFLSILMIFSAFAAKKSDLDRAKSEMALEAYNFMSGIEQKELSASQQQLHRQGMKRLAELARLLSFKPYEEGETLELAGNRKCNEYYLLKVQGMAFDRAIKACRADLTEGSECVEFSSKIVRNIRGECQAFATVHKVKVFKE